MLHLAGTVRFRFEKVTSAVAFQLVLATDDQITVWHTDHGHIFLFNIDREARQLAFGWCKDIKEAPVRAEILQSEAQLFAEAEARSRLLIA